MEFVVEYLKHPQLDKETSTVKREGGREGVGRGGTGGRGGGREG